MVFTYETTGICAKVIDIELEENKIKNIKFFGGCNGNGKSIAALLVGMDKDDAVVRLEGITCGPRDTSCGDQLSKALKSIA